MAVEAELRAAAEAWIADDPDAGDRAELRALLDRAGRGADTRAAAELRDRFAGRLTFGTAGLRGAVAAGPNRVNRAVVRAASAAVAGWLLRSGSGAGVVVGCDARHRSAEFAGEAAAVLAGAGIAVRSLPVPCATPLLAFAVTHLGAAAGVMITASHNPAADNGYKLYLSDGGQVIPPVDAEIEQRMARIGPLTRIAVADPGSPLITRHGDEVAQAYLDAVAVADPGAAAGLNVVYTPMHGVAGQLMLRAFRRAGFAPPHVVAAQAEPDPGFPTVAFPNPEEPGALDMALADARRLGADLVIASDPDGDRLAVAVPGAGGDCHDGWRVLTGDQVGALLGASALERTAADGDPRQRLVASTVVSATLLAKITAAAGARYVETLTGFKWIARAADRVPGTRFVFGYEEALGYAVGDVVRDKDGIGAALAMLRVAGAAKAAGRSVLSLYDDLETAHGVHLTCQVTLRTAEAAAVMRQLRARPPASLGGQPVSGLTDLARPPGGFRGAGVHGPAAPRVDVLVFRLAGARVALRPSGTEPKIKCYIEVVEPLAGRPLQAARGLAAGRLAPLRAALEALLGAG